jgi:hypothetical protein
VWTIGQNGVLYGLDPATGKVRQQVSIGAPANHFPTPSVAGGLLLAPSADRVVAFAARASGAASATPAATAPANAGATPSPAGSAGPGRASPGIAVAAVSAGVVAMIGLGWLAYRRMRRAR